jgi:hypothetical protein
VATFSVASSGSLERSLALAFLDGEQAGSDYVTYFSFPYFDMPQIAKPFELRERPDDKLPYDPKNIRGSRSEASNSELAQKPEATALPPETQAQPNASAAVKDIQQEAIIPDDASEQQTLTFKG